MGFCGFKNDFFFPCCTPVPENDNVMPTSFYVLLTQNPKGHLASKLFFVILQPLIYNEWIFLLEENIIFSSQDI